MQPYQYGIFLRAIFLPDEPPRKSLHQSLALIHSHMVDAIKNLLYEAQRTLAARMGIGDPA